MDLGLPTKPFDFLDKTDFARPAQSHMGNTLLVHVMKRGVELEDKTHEFLGQVYHFFFFLMLGFVP
jgi:hypothetical protein